MKIVSWNVDWYRNGRRSKYGKYVETDSSNTICKKITNVIVKFLDEDSVNMVCLQEVPYKCNYSCRANHLLYNETFNSFKSYSTFVANKSCKCAYARTMVISQDAWKNSDDEYSGDKSNHVIQIKKDQVKIMALHMPPIQMPKKDDKEVEDVEGSSVNRKLWENIIDQCKKSKPQIVLGDFNTDDSRTEQFRQFQKLIKLGYYEPDGDAKSKPTFNNKTHIDYILVRNDLKDRVKSYKIYEEGIELSDHEPLIIDIDI